MKEIDILNGIASGEIKPGFKIKSKKGDIYEFVEGKGYFVNTKDKMYIWTLGDFNKLNNEVEIIEEDKEIEIKQEYTNKGKLHDYLYYRGSKYQLSLPQIVLFKEIEKVRNELNKLKGK